MIQFILGAAGTGKSTLVSKLIVNDLKAGKRVLLLVPEQQAVESEQMIADVSSDINTVELEVLNFSRLANRVFRKFGGLSYNYIDNGARALIMWRTLVSLSPTLNEFGDISLTDRGFIKLMLETVKDFKAYNIRPFMLESAAEAVEAYREGLSRRLYDVALIYSAYENMMSTDYNDPLDDLTLLSHTLERNDFFGGYNVYIDSFNGFTPQQYTVLRHILSQSDNATVALEYAGDDPSPAFESLALTERTLRRLAADCHLYSAPDIMLTEQHRFKNNELAYIAENLWNFSGSQTKPYDFVPENVGIIECGDKFTEAESAAKDILRKVRAGARYRDFVISARDINSYKGIIDAVLDKYNIPYFMSVREDLTSKPLIKLILAALTIIYANWRAGDVISYLKTGLASVSHDECDILESYVMTWSINGRRWTDDYEWNLNPDGYTDVLTERGQSVITLVNELRNRITAPLIKFAGSFGKDCTVRSVSSALYDYLCELDIPQKLTELDSDESSQLWNSIMNILDQLVTVAADLHVTAEQYSQLLYMIISETDMGKIPASIDEVLIGNAPQLRAGQKKHMYILGVNEGVFPQSISENTMFNDSDRILLEGLGVKLPADSDELASDELFHFYSVATCVSDSLTLIYSSSDLSGKTQKPSSACEQICQLFPLLEVVKYSSLPPIDMIEGYEASFEYVNRYRDTELGMALLDFYSKDPEYNSRIEALEMPITQIENKLDSDTAEKLYGGNLSLTQSRLDSYVLCRFAYYSKYVLRLSEKKRASFRSVDIGNFIHRILERFMRAVSTPDGLRNDLSEEEIENIVDEIIADYLEALRDKSRRLEYLFNRLRRTSLLLIHNLLEEFAQSHFVPKYFELPIKFGDPEAVMPLRIPLYDGTNAYIYGYVDRVDTYKKGKDVYVRIIDYKTGIQEFSLSDIQLGLNLQMLLYLFAIWQNPSENFKASVECEGDIFPAGVLYFSARSPEVPLNRAEPTEDIIEAANRALTRKGLLIQDEEILRAMDKRLEGRYIPVKIKKDGDFAVGAPLATLEEFGELMRSIMMIVQRISADLKNGEASAVPLRTNTRDACQYCPDRPFCRKV